MSGTEAWTSRHSNITSAAHRISSTRNADSGGGAFSTWPGTTTGSGNRWPRTSKSRFQCTAHRRILRQRPRCLPYPRRRTTDGPPALHFTSKSFAADRTRGFRGAVRKPTPTAPRLPDCKDISCTGHRGRKDPSIGCTRSPSPRRTTWIAARHPDPFAIGSRPWITGDPRMRVPRPVP